MTDASPELAGVQVPGRGVRVQTDEGVREIPRMGRGGMPICPAPIADEVELYAREGGRHATVHFAPGAGWFARFTLKDDDPRLELYKTGQVSEPPTEDVWFHVPDPEKGPGNYRPLDIVQLGPSGVRSFLERGNTWSGRGESGSLVESTRKRQEKNLEARKRHRQEAKEANRRATREMRRTLLNIPFLRVGIDLKDEDGA